MSAHHCWSSSKHIPQTITFRVFLIKLINSTMSTYRATARILRSLMWQAAGANYSSSSLTSGRHLMSRYPAGIVRYWSSASSSSSAPPVDLPKDKEEINQQVSSASPSDHKQDVKNIVSYWGIIPTKVTKEDGSAWRWNCFRVSVHTHLRKLTSNN